MNNGWYFYDYENFVIKKRIPYTDVKDISSSLKSQALEICLDHKPLVFLSGGIDSQVMALAFLMIDSNATYIYIRPSLNKKYNETEYFYVKNFAKKYKIDLKIIELDFSIDSLKDFLIETNYFNSPVGTGTVFLLEGIERTKKIYEGTPITADGHFVFMRNGKVCSGSFKKPGLLLSEGIKVENQILFDFYSSHMFAFYEFIHRNTPEYQWPSKMEAKNIFYNNLGLPLRPKMSSWEFIDQYNDYSTLSTIDWSNDHSEKARHVLGISALCDTLKLDTNLIIKKKRLQKDDTNRFVKLYEFDIDWDFYHG